MSAAHPPRSGGAKPARHTAIPTEWRIELPERGAQADAEFGGCRSIESGYVRGPVLGQGTYGEVRSVLPALMASMGTYSSGCTFGNALGKHAAACGCEVERRAPARPPARIPYTAYPCCLLPGPIRSTSPPTCKPRRRWLPKRSRWTTRRRASPSQPSARWVLGCTLPGAGSAASSRCRASHHRLPGRRLSTIVSWHPNQRGPCYLCADQDPVGPGPHGPGARRRQAAQQRDWAARDCAIWQSPGQQLQGGAGLQRLGAWLFRGSAGEGRNARAPFEAGSRVAAAAHPPAHLRVPQGSIYMIFDYMDHDMTGLLERSQRDQRRFNTSQARWLAGWACGVLAWTCAAPGSRWPRSSRSVL